MTRRLRIISFLAAMGCFAIGATISYLGFEVWPPSATLADSHSAEFKPADIQICIRGRGLAWLGDSSGEAYWQACRDWLTRYQALTGFEFRFWSVIGTSLAGLVALFGFALSLRLDSVSLEVLRGARLQAGSGGLRAFGKAAAAECQVHGKGVALVPSIPLGREREARHFLIVGSVGGGKTQTMLHLISEALSRGDGLLVLDTKGDMMGGLPADGDPLLVAPHDRRSLVWDVAADCSIKQDARELAARFIPPSSDPMWSQAAQEIFVACIVYLQATRGKEWGWADLQRVVTADVGKLAAYAKDHNPNALRLLDQPESKTTLSILTTFQTHMQIVSVLAEAWSDPTAGRFSIRNWLHHPTPFRPLILQHDPGYPELSRIWIGSMLGLLASAVGSPTLAESRERRVWLFLDEFPQLPPIKQFPTFLELGRSKGVAVVIGAQDTAQIRAVYGQDQAKSWFGMTGTKIITRINASEAAEDISRLIGEQEVERRTKSSTHAGGKTSVTESTQREMRRVITASELGSRLGPTKDGVRILFIGLGEDVYELELPYLKLRQLREPIMPADWTRPFSRVRLSEAANDEADPDPTPAPARLTKDLAAQILKRRE
ncbi:type IV secretion system DNA-binding domain-containing protein [Bradyrhizobium ontarionense]|uniref:Type IV secretion system DNA-binding domain-containing protein n=1 Tax=Bradyrhizobium ontarionense TaxID=2898149 RepID=A0ABY3R6E5_9BRAD|nr:type IV secretion system DNA-binding domain-containing protein [Bradyrhizobium sp. A19]UFZ02627.1 type IV secretion system DNA-binding domain-containing protein [Bradyrhizobium sp. A19]